MERIGNLERGEDWEPKTWKGIGISQVAIETKSGNLTLDGNLTSFGNQLEMEISCRYGNVLMYEQWTCYHEVELGLD